MLTYDLVIKNCRLVNMFTEEIYPADIGINGGKISRAADANTLCGAKTVDAGGRFAVPGLIDVHTHIESGMLVPCRLAEEALKRGVTTIIADPHEICNVLGAKGLNYFLEATENLPLKFHFLVPSCVPAARGFETSADEFSAGTVREYIDHPRCAGLGEMMNFPGVLRHDPHVMAILDAAGGRFIGGHAPTLAGEDLDTYREAGIESDHECRDAEEAIRKLRAGLRLECRYASNSRDLPDIAKGLVKLGVYDSACLCTDDREVDDLIGEGHLDAAVRVAVAAGIPPVKAIKMGTLNAARHVGLKDRGAIFAGGIADIVLLDRLEDFSVWKVFADGAEFSRIPPMEHPLERENTVKFHRELTVGDFVLPAGRKMNAIRFDPDNPFVTKLAQTESPAAVMAVIERHGVSGGIGLCPLEGFPIKAGAVAGTVCHDCHNLFVIGTDPADMLAAANALIKCGGGYAIAQKGAVTDILELPVFGLMADIPARELAERTAKMKAAARDMGITGDSPLNFLAFFGLSVLPEVRLTDLGLVDSVKQEFIPLFCQ